VRFIDTELCLLFSTASTCPIPQESITRYRNLETTTRRIAISGDFVKTCPLASTRRRHLKVTATPDVALSDTVRFQPYDLQRNEHEQTNHGIRRASP
jgi:hypothetical protein